MKELDIVRTLVDRQDIWTRATIPAGTVGTIVMVCGADEMFEVETGDNGLGDYAPDEIEACVKRRRK